MSALVHLPRPMTHDAGAIFEGRTRALAQYSGAKTNEERRRALEWSRHWRALDRNARALDELKRRP